MLKVYIHTSSWNISKNNTDLRLRHTLQSLQNYYEDVEIYIPTKLFAGIHFNINYVVNSLINKSKKLLKIKSSNYKVERSKIYLPEIKKFRPDLIITQGHFPVINYGIPIIWEIFFVDPKEFNVNPNPIDFKVWEQKVKAIKRLSSSVQIIGVRDLYSIELFKRLIPNEAEKIRFLPFFLPDLEPIDEEEIKKKHQNIETYKLLFVGGQAKLKGLEILIKAIQIIESQLPNLVQLDVVSKMIDGQIVIPKELPIINHGSLEHESVIQLFKKSHLYVMPSLSDSFGLSYIEGLANGCVVFARNKQPQKDILDYGNCGILIDPINASEIAEKIINICLNNEKRISIAIKGLEKFKKNYYWPIVGKMWHEAMKDAIK